MNEQLLIEHIEAAMTKEFEIGSKEFWFNHGLEKARNIIIQLADKERGIK